MDYISTLEFPKEEQNSNNELNKLFKEWVTVAKSKKLPENYHADDLVFEGFYPYYQSQPKKILFIGRESLGISGCNYIDTLYQSYKTHYIGDLHVNKHITHRRLLKIAYGLINGCQNYESIPDADVIAKDFGTDNGISFAFMNISKFSNEFDDFKSDWNLINNFIDLFCDNKFSAKQIETVNPDLIISMNLENKIDTIGSNDFVDCSSSVAYRKLTINQKTYNLLDTYHFAAICKYDHSDFYDPIVSMCKKHNL